MYKVPTYVYAVYNMDYKTVQYLNILTNMRSKRLNFSGTFSVVTYSAFKKH